MSQTNLSESQVREALAGFLSVIQAELSMADNKVTIHGLGTFKANAKGDKTARNPRTGEQCYVKPYIKVTFASSTLFYDITNGKR